MKDGALDAFFFTGGAPAGAIAELASVRQGGTTTLGRFCVSPGIAAALLMVAPSLTATLIGVAMVVPVLLRQFKDWRAAPVLS